MASIICLANSLKHNGRCVAGIDIATGQWIRPVSRLSSGRISVERSTINGEPIQPLDLVEIPLANTGQGYECENRLILPGDWQRLDKVGAETMLQYCEQELLYSDHNDWINAVPYSYLLILPLEERRTLQIIETHHFRVWQNEYGKWKGGIPLTDGTRMVANITDPVLCRKLHEGYVLNQRCLVALSFSQPWKKPDVDSELLCYRLIVGVVELERG